MLSMILSGMAVTCNGDEIGVSIDISWEDTKNAAVCKVGKGNYASIFHDPERIPF